MDSQRSLAEQRIDSDFGRTHWSMVAAVHEGGALLARRSLRELCRRYWVPVYAYIRRTGHSPEYAATLVRRFLSHLVERLKIRAPDVRTGFRNYLQTELEAFLASDMSALASSAEPADDLSPPWPLEEIELRQAMEHPADSSPAQALQRGFALELLAIALYRLRNEAEQSDRGMLFEQVRPYLSQEPSAADYGALAERMRSSPLAMVIAVKRLRQRFQELIDEELAQTVGNAQSLEAERQTLLSLASPELMPEKDR